MTKDDSEGGRQLIAPWLQFHNSSHLWAASFLSPQENTQEHFPNCLGVIVAASPGQQKLSAPLQLLLSTVWAKSSAQEQAHLSSSHLRKLHFSLSQEGGGRGKWLIVHHYHCGMMSYCRLSYEIPVCLCTQELSVCLQNCGVCFVFCRKTRKRSSEHPCPYLPHFWKDSQFILEPQPPSPNQQPFPRPAGCPGEEC